MNMAQSGWKFKDHIDSRASAGDENYINLANILYDDRYRSIPTGTIFAAVTSYYNNSSNGLTKDVIKTGLLNFPQERIPFITDKLDQLLPVMETICEKKITGKKDLFLNAIMFLISIQGMKNDFDFDVFLENFKQLETFKGNRDGIENCMDCVVKIHNSKGKRRYRFKDALEILNQKTESDKKWVKNLKIQQAKELAYEGSKG